MPHRLKQTDGKPFLHPVEQKGTSHADSKRIVIESQRRTIGEPMAEVSIADFCLNSAEQFRQPVVALRS